MGANLNVVEPIIGPGLISLLHDGLTFAEVLAMHALHHLREHRRADALEDKVRLQRLHDVLEHLLRRPLLSLLPRWDISGSANAVDSML